MIAWWWIPVVFLFGTCFGAALMGVCAYDNVKRSRSGKRWWEDEQ